MAFIRHERSIIPACDVPDLYALEELVQATRDIEKVSAYKIGAKLALQFGLPQVVDSIRNFTDHPIIYDHQKAGNDIPGFGKEFMDAIKEDIDAVILFPFAGSATEEAWIREAQNKGLHVIVGGEMTHEKFLVSQGGYIDDDAPDEIYLVAADLGVRDFVVPGNKPKRIAHYRDLLKDLNINPIFYSPGLISQGGTITEAAKAAGHSWHAIIGRAIYQDRIE